MTSHRPQETDAPAERRIHRLRAMASAKLRGWRQRRRWIRWSAYGLAALLVLGLALTSVPVPYLNSLLAGYLSDRIASQTACPGATAKPPTVTVKGGALLPQLMRRRLSEIELSIPELSANGAKRAVFTATLREVSQPEPETTHVGAMAATIDIGFADLPPPPPGQPVPSNYAQGEDGALAVSVTVDPEAAKNVRTKLYLKMDLNGRTMTSTPQQMTIFGKTLPAAKVRAMTGGPRKQTLPALPAGLAYKSISPERDGLHVRLDGVSTTPLNTLPTEFGGQTVSYVAKNGLLGISTAVKVPPIVDIPLTIFVEPRLRNATMTMVPRSVEIFGANRPATDPIAQLVFSQIDPKDLTRKLPALPAGLRYRSVRVDSAGIQVAVGGVTVQPYSQLPVPKGSPPTTFGAENGLLTASTIGAGGRTMPVVVYSKPTITENTLDLRPQRIRMFDTMFDAKDVFAEVEPQPTTFALQPLPTGLRYDGVEVLPEGLRINLSGTDVTLGPDLLGGGTC